jgi:hypothetical protein
MKWNHKKIYLVYVLTRKMSSEIICGSFEEHKGYFISHAYEKKNILRVKIIKYDTKNKNSQESIESIESIEEKINNVLLDFNGKYEIIDIKYTDSSCMIIYKRLN